MASPGARRGLAASDFVDASLGGGELAPSPIFGRQLGMWLATGVGGDSCRHADSRSGGNGLVANAKAFCHVSAKKLVGETQYSGCHTIAPPE